MKGERKRDFGAKEDVSEIFFVLPFIFFFVGPNHLTVKKATPVFCCRCSKATKVYKSRNTLQNLGYELLYVPCL